MPFPCQVDTRDNKGQLIYTSEWTMVIRGAGGFNGPTSSSAVRAPVSVPSGAPDHVTTQSTLTAQVSLSLIFTCILSPKHLFF